MNDRRDFPATDELEALLARAETDPEASRELDFLADVCAAAERLGTRASAPAAPLPGLFARAWLIPAAASLLFALALGLWFARRGADPRTALAHGAPPIFVPSELRGDDGLAAEFARAMEPYVRAEWSAARSALEAFLAAHRDHLLARFYLAVVLAETGEPASAREHYSAVVTSDEPLLADHARFRRALLDIAADRSEGESELEALAAGDGPFAELARQILPDARR